MSRSRRCAAVLLWICLIDSACSRPHGRPRVRNVLLVSIDTLRADHLGCYGYARETSPNIDALAGRGVRFENYFTVSPKTGPSVATTFTGKYIQNHGVTANWMKLASPNTTMN